MFKATSKTVLIALLAGVAACNDGAVAPHNQSAQLANVSGGGALATLTQTDTLNFSFTIDPSVDRTIYLGAGNNLHIPAGSLCDLSSSYGPTEWDNSCTAATEPVTVSASAWLDSANHPRVDFGTHLRFVPSSDPANWVTITFTDTAAAQNPTADILYCATSYSECVSELTGDATLVTVENTVTSKVTRRIKHFSGYILYSGEPCVPSPMNPDCVEGGDGYNRISAPLKLSLPNTASASIGPKGGVLSLPSAGLQVVVPAGALRKMTTLSVSANAGSMSYQFAPHGTQFAKAVRVTQDLRTANVSASSLTTLRAVYLASDAQFDAARGTVTPTEVMAVDVSKGLSQASFNIHHFSSYMFVTGEPCTPSPMSPDCNAGADYNRTGTDASVSSVGLLRAVTRLNATTARITK